jgi:hypothetical protein
MAHIHNAAFYGDESRCMLLQSPAVAAAAVVVTKTGAEISAPA